MFEELAALFEVGAKLDDLGNIVICSEFH
jgi:hypothetical protein